MSELSFSEMFRDRRVISGLSLSLTIVVLMILWRWWATPAVIEQNNLKYVQLLWTATSSRNPGQLNKVEEAIRQRATQGEMSPAALAEFERIIRQAQSGDWEEASKACYHLAEGQQNRWRSQAPEDSQQPHGRRHSH